MVENSQKEVLNQCLETNFWTWSAQNQVKPIPVSRAEGVYFWDFEGRRYLDFNSMVMCVNIGHGNSSVIERICRQAHELSFAGPQMATAIRAEIGQKLKTITPPGLNRYLYTLGGADANENALKIARAYSGKHKVLARYRSYHGATHGAIALTGDRRRLAWEPNVMPGVVHFLDPYRYRSTFHQGNVEISEEEFSKDYLNHLEEIIQYEGPDTIAAILIETVTGTNGIIIPPQGYLQGVRKLCDQYKILLITDEVMSGFGRTGRWFAVEHWDVIPDILTMAKGLTSGYAPLGAVAMKQEIAESFRNRVFYGGLTYNGHPISLAAACATIDVIKQDGLIENAEKLGNVLRKKLKKLQEKHPCIGEFRQIGLFAAIELVKDRETHEPISPFNKPQSPVMRKIHGFIQDHGLFLYTHFNLILIIPPIIITESQLTEGLTIIDEALSIGDNELRDVTLFNELHRKS